MRPDRDLFLNSMYDRQNDQLILVMRDVVDDVKKIVKIDKPKIDLYRYKNKTDIFLEYALLKDVDKFSVPYKYKDSEIAKMLGIDTKVYWEVVRKDRAKAKAIKLNKIILGSDINIEDFYIMKYMDSFNHSTGPDGYEVYDDTPPIKNLHKSYLDMEWDYTKSDDNNEHPVYLITYIDGKAKISYTYYLYNKEFNGIDYIEENKEAFIERIKMNVQEHIKIENLNISRDKAEKVQPILQKIADKMQYVIKKYDDEQEMIKDAYQLAYREYKPDFLDIYNAEADIGQAIRRYEYFGGDIKDLFTCPEVGDTIDFKMDDDRFEPNERNHTYNSSSYTKLTCSYQRYHTLRSTEKFSNRGLSDTALREIGMKKLSFKHVCSTIGELPYLDFQLAVEYNIRDVLLMDFLESCTNDIEYSLSLRLLKTTDYDRLYIPLVGVYNSFYHISLRNGKIMGNNYNGTLNGLTKEEMEYFKERDPFIYKMAKVIKTKKKIKAGLCSGPAKFKGEGRKEMLSFLASFVIRNIFDIDATSEYPNAIISGNMSKTAIYGRIIKVMEEEINEGNIFGFTQALINRDNVAICREFFNLPGITEIIETLGINIPKINKISSYQEDFDIFKDKVDKDRFTSLNNIFSKLTNPKQDKKDLETEENPLRGVYLIGDTDETSYRYFGSLISYKIIENDSMAVITPFDYLGYGNENEPVLVVDGVNKEINNTYLIDMRRNKMDKNIVEDKPLEFVDKIDVTNLLGTICNPKRLLKSKIDIGKVRLSIPSRFLAFPIQLCKSSIVKEVKSFSTMPKASYIFPNTEINVTSIGDVEITSIDNIVKGNNIIEFKNKKGKIKKLELYCVDVSLSIYKVKDIEEDYVYKGILNYSLPLDEDHTVLIKQEFFFINYKE